MGTRYRTCIKNDIEYQVPVPYRTESATRDEENNKSRIWYLKGMTNSQELTFFVLLELVLKRCLVHLHIPALHLPVFLHEPRLCKLAAIVRGLEKRLN
jgi:hypothetical protein